MKRRTHTALIPSGSICYCAACSLVSPTSTFRRIARVFDIEQNAISGQRIRLWYGKMFCKSKTGVRCMVWYGMVQYGMVCRCPSNRNCGTAYYFIYFFKKIYYFSIQQVG